jgi:pyrophosphatase PpaX
MIKAILFDLDGTLLDSVPTILSSNHRVCTAMGIPYDETTLRGWIGIPLEDQAQRLAEGREKEYVENYRKAYWDAQMNNLKLFPGTAKMLDDLRLYGYKTALVTSKGSKITRMTLELSGIAEKFDVIVAAEDTKEHKPHPAPILKGLELLGIKPEEAIYVGDSFFDVDAAQHANVRMAAVSWGARNKDDLELMCPDTVFDTWQGFVTWLDGPGHRIDMNL